MTRFGFRSSTLCLIALASLCLSGELAAQSVSSSVSSSNVDYAIASPLPSAPDASPLPSAPEPQNGAAQQQSTPPQQSQHDRAAKQLRQEEHQRILGVIPNFNSTSIQNAAPLTVKQKFGLMGRSVIDPFEFFASGVIAGYGQATDSHSGYGQGAQGYGKRYGATYADSADGAFWGNAVLPSLLHQDPRYFRQGTGGFWSRFKYSILTTVWTRNDNGTRGPNYSNVFGNLISGGISNIYYPSADRGVGLTFEGAATVTAEGALGSLGIEFWPDIAHRYFHAPLPAQTDEPAPK